MVLCSSFDDSVMGRVYSYIYNCQIDVGNCSDLSAPRIGLKMMLLNSSDLCIPQIRPKMMLVPILTFIYRKHIAT